MPWMIPAAIIGSAVVGGVASAKSSKAQAQAQESANTSNVNLNRENREWQEQMSNTSYLRAVTDMKSAGLNPMLAYSQGGASTPSSSAAQVQPVVDNPLGAGLSGASASADRAVQLASVVQGVRQSEAQERLLAAQVPGAMAESAAKMTSAKQAELDLAARMKAVDVFQNAYIARANRNFQEDRYEGYIARNKFDQGSDWYDMIRRHPQAALDLMAAQTAYGNASARSRELGLSADRAEAGFFESRYGKAWPYVSRGLEGLGSVVGSAKGLMSMMPRRRMDYETSILRDANRDVIGTYRREIPMELMFTK